MIFIINLLFGILKELLVLVLITIPFRRSTKRRIEILEQKQRIMNMRMKNKDEEDND